MRHITRKDLLPNTRMWVSHTLHGDRFGQTITISGRSHYKSRTADDRTPVTVRFADGLTIIATLGDITDRNTLRPERTSGNYSKAVLEALHRDTDPHYCSRCQVGFDDTFERVTGQTYCSWCDEEIRTNHGRTIIGDYIADTGHFVTDQPAICYQRDNEHNLIRRVARVNHCIVCQCPIKRGRKYCDEHSLAAKVEQRRLYDQRTRSTPIPKRESDDELVLTPEVLT